MSSVILDTNDENNRKRKTLEELTNQVSDGNFTPPSAALEPKDTEHPLPADEVMADEMEGGVIDVGSPDTSTVAPETSPTGVPLTEEEQAIIQQQSEQAAQELMEQDAMTMEESMQSPVETGIVNEDAPPPTGEELPPMPDGEQPYLDGGEQTVTTPPSPDSPEAQAAAQEAYGMPTGFGQTMNQASQQYQVTPSPVTAEGSVYTEVPLTFDIPPRQGAADALSAISEVTKYRPPQQISQDIRRQLRRQMQRSSLRQPNMRSDRSPFDDSGDSGETGRGIAGLFGNALRWAQADLQKAGSILTNKDDPMSGGFKFGKEKGVNPFAGFAGFGEDMQEAMDSGDVGKMLRTFTTIVPRYISEGTWGEFGQGWLPGLFYGLSLPQNLLVGGLTDLYESFNGDQTPEDKTPNIIQALNGKDYSFSEQRSAEKPLSLVGGNEKVKTIGELFKRSPAWWNPLVSVPVLAYDKVRDVIVGEDRDTLPIAVPGRVAQGYEFLSGLGVDAVTDPADFAGNAWRAGKRALGLGTNAAQTADNVATAAGRTVDEVALPRPELIGTVDDVAAAADDVAATIPTQKVDDIVPVQATDDVAESVIPQVDELSPSRMGIDEASSALPNSAFDSNIEAITARSNRISEAKLLPEGDRQTLDVLTGNLMDDVTMSPGQLEESVGELISPPKPPAAADSVVLPPATVAPDLAPSTSSTEYMGSLMSDFKSYADESLGKKQTSLILPMDRMTNDELADLARTQNILPGTGATPSTRRLTIMTGQGAEMRYVPIMEAADDLGENFSPEFAKLMDDIQAMAVDAPNNKRLVNIYQSEIMPIDLVTKTDEGLAATAKFLRDKQVFESIGNEAAFLQKKYDEFKRIFSEDMLMLENLPDVGRRAIDEEFLTRLSRETAPQRVIDDITEQAVDNVYQGGKLHFEGRTLDVKAHPLASGIMTTLPAEELRKAVDAVTPDNQIGDRVAQVKEFLATSDEINAPEVIRRKNGDLVFKDGRHRAYVMQEAGMKDIPVNLIDEAMPTKVKKQIVKEMEQAEALKELTFYHGTKVQGLDLQRANPVVGGARSEIGTVLHFSNDSRVAGFFAEGLPNRNAIPGKEVNETGHLFEVRLNPNRMLKTDEAIPETLVQELADVAKTIPNLDSGARRKISAAARRKDITYEGLLQRIDDVLADTYSEFPEEIATQIQRNVVEVLQRNQIDGVYKQVDDAIHVGVTNPKAIANSQEVAVPNMDFTDMPKSDYVKQAYAKYMGDEVTANMYPKSKSAKVNASESLINYEKEVLQDLAIKTERANQVSAELAYEMVEQEAALRRQAINEMTQKANTKAEIAARQNENQIKHMAKPERGIC